MKGIMSRTMTCGDEHSKKADDIQNKGKEGAVSYATVGADRPLDRRALRLNPQKTQNVGGWGEH